jgi:hypothetical protein
MTPVMERCPCTWPVAECIEHGPPRAPADDHDGLTQTTARVLVIMTAVCVVLDVVVVVGVVKAVEWLLGLIG